MPKRSNDFQRLIAAIERQLAPLGAVVTESKLIKERSSNIEREVDIAIESSLGQHSVLIAIECRDHKRRSDLDWIDSLIGKYRDLPVEKIVAVSRSGFTKGAVKKAKEVNISTVTLEAAIDAKLIPSTQRRKLPLKYAKHNTPNFYVYINQEDHERFGDYLGDMKRGKVYRPDGTSESVLVEILKSEITKARFEEATHNPPEFKEGPLTPVTVAFPEGTKIVDDGGRSYRLLEVTTEQSVEIETTELQLSSFRYMDVELLSGEIETESFKFHILLLYKAGLDVYQYVFHTEGDLLTIELKFGEATR